MLADRQYMRRDNVPTPWSITIVLLVFNILVFFLEYSDGARSKNWFLEYGALSLEGLKRGFIWQFITFQFLHGGLPHLVLNSLGLYFFGRPLEGMLGRRDFLKLYLFSGVIGGVLQALLGFIFPQIAGPMVGASAGICGLVAAFSVLAPDSQIYVWFVLPIRARYFLPIMFGLTLLFLVTSIKDTSTEGSHVAHAAHLGGILGGIAYLRWRHGLAVPCSVGLVSVGPSLGASWSPPVQRGTHSGERKAPSPWTIFSRRNSSAVKWTRYSTKSPLTVSRA